MWNSIITNGVICIALYIIGIIYYIIRKRNFKIIKNSLKAIDLKTIIMLALIRLMLPKVFLPATTALGSIDS